MGPLVLTSGRRARTWRSPRFGYGFNGAAGSHQRKGIVHGQGVPGVERASMGPLVLTSGRPRETARGCRSARLQWGRWFSPAEGPLRRQKPGWRPNSFNGAAGSHQRKEYPPELGLHDLLGLQWGRWFSPAEGRSCASTAGPRKLRFNGAAGSHQRKAAFAGHAVLPCSPASMGPLVLTSGRPASAQIASRCGSSLQWGRWFSPAEGTRSSLATSSAR